MEFLRNLFSGMVIGVANIIPGVSGGTMAVVLGIYDRLISSVSTIFRDMKKNLLFLIPVGLGAGAGILLFSTLIKFLLGSYPMATNFFFLGLILGSVPMIYRRAVCGGFKPIHLLPLLLALAVMLILTFGFSDVVSTELIRDLNLGVSIRLFICSVVAAACMILPGVSGSMVLMLLGVYTSILTAISELHVLFLLPVAAGVAVGILGGAKVIDICLRRAPQATYCAILGLIVGSVFPVFRSAGFALNLQGAAAVGTLLAGAAASILLARLQKRLDRA